MWITSILNALLLATLLAFSHGLLKWVSAHSSNSYMQTLSEYWWVITIAIGIYVGIFFYYAYVLRTVPIGILYPTYTGLSVVFVFLIGIWLFGEPVSLVQVLGCAVIIAGVAMVSGSVG